MYATSIVIVITLAFVNTVYSRPKSFNGLINGNKLILLSHIVSKDDSNSSENVIVEEISASTVVGDGLNTDSSTNILGDSAESAELSTTPLVPVESSTSPEPQCETSTTPLDATTTVDYNKPSIPRKDLPYLLEKYKGKVVVCSPDRWPQCEVILCGSIHVTKSSSLMVEEVIDVLKPKFVMLELCEARVDSLLEASPSERVTLVQVFKETFATRSAKTFSMGLLSWMQAKAASLLGNQLGAEQVAGARVGARNRAMLVLGDRHYAVTIQRVMDRLNLWAKVKVLLIFIWEMMTMTVIKLKEYIKKSEDDSTFIHSELQKFAEHLPEMADTIINERDEYMAQTLCEIARVGFGPYPVQGPCRVVAVVGAGHIPGLQRWVKAGGVSDQRLLNISTSSKQTHSCWPGRGSLHLVNTETLFGNVVPIENTVGE